jgi:hypothetical protein
LVSIAADVLDAVSPADVLNLVSQHLRAKRWLAILAGLNEKWSREPGIDDVSDDLWLAVLAFDLTNPIPEAGDGKSG